MHKFYYVFGHIIYRGAHLEKPKQPILLNKRVVNVNTTNFIVALTLHNFRKNKAYFLGDNKSQHKKKKLDHTPHHTISYHATLE